MLPPSRHPRSRRPRKSQPRRGPVAALCSLALLAAACSADVGEITAEVIADPAGAAASSDPAIDDETADSAAAQTPETGDQGGEQTDPADDAPSAGGDGAAGGATGTIAGPNYVDEYYPHLGNAAYQVEHYDLTIDWDEESRAIDAVAVLDLVPAADLDGFHLDFHALEIGTVSVNGQPAEFERVGREVKITTSETLQAGENAVVEMTYAGVPELVPDSAGPFSGGWTDLGDAVIVAGEPAGASSWYPVNEHPADKATYEITIIADVGVTVAASGTALAPEPADDGRASHTFVSDDPIASYVVTVAIGDFVRHEGLASQSGVPVRHFFQPDVYDDGVATMERTGEMIDAFEAMLGEYPFDLYGSVVVDDELGFALETQTMSVFGGDVVDPFGTYEDVVAHELAHQWFGNHVSLDQWSDIWLNEGFATYSQYLWFEFADPDYDIGAELANEYDAYAWLLSVPPGAPPADDLFHPSVYLRGAFALHALRVTIGDDAFFSVLRTWVAEYGGQNAITSDFIRLTEDISGQDLGDFFDDWLFATDIPPLPEG